MEQDEHVADQDSPLHLQQLKHTAAALLSFKAQSDSVTWVADTVPEFVKDAIQQGLTVADRDITASLPSSFNQSQDTADTRASEHFTTAAAGSLAPVISPPPDTAADQSTAAPPPQTTATASAAAGPALILGSQHWHSGGTSSHSKRVDWVVTTCLVPDGMPTAAAADAGGGLAALEVVCRVLVLQDCQPAVASPGLVQALKKVRWQEFGLTFKEFYSSTGVDDPTGILTLGVLPDAVVTPLALIVCSCIPIISSAGLNAPADTLRASDSQAYTTAVDNSQLNPSQLALDPTQATEPAEAATDDTYAATDSKQIGRKRKCSADAATTSCKRKKGTSNSAAAKVPSLSNKREKELYIGAFEAALVELKKQLPQGYLQGKLESLVTACLPSIATSLANMLVRSSNPHIREDACDQLSCKPLQLQQHLLNKLQITAATAVAAKSQTAASRKQQKQGKDGNRARRAGADAAAVAAAAGDVMGDEEDSDQQQQQQQQQSQRDMRDQQQQQQWSGQQQCELQLHNDDDEEEDAWLGALGFKNEWADDADGQLRQQQQQQLYRQPLQQAWLDSRQPAHRQQNGNHWEQQQQQSQGQHPWDSVGLAAEGCAEAPAAAAAGAFWDIEGCYAADRPAPAGLHVARPDQHNSWQHPEQMAVAGQQQHLGRQLYHYGTPDPQESITAAPAAAAGHQQWQQELSQQPGSWTLVSRQRERKAAVFAEDFSQLKEGDLFEIADGSAQLPAAAASVAAPAAAEVLSRRALQSAGLAEMLRGVQQPGLAEHQLGLELAEPHEAAAQDFVWHNSGADALKVPADRVQMLEPGEPADSAVGVASGIPGSRFGGISWHHSRKKRFSGSAAADLF